jgi:hypothetical protein
VLQGIVPLGAARSGVARFEPCKVHPPGSVTSGSELRELVQILWLSLPTGDVSSLPRHGTQRRGELLQRMTAQVTGYRQSSGCTAYNRNSRSL